MRDARLSAAGHLHTIGTDGGLIMWRDPIVEEVRRTRDEYARRFNYDLEAIVRDVQARQKKSGGRVVDRSKPAAKSRKPAKTRRARPTALKKRGTKARK